MPRPSPPPWVPKRLAPPSRRQRSSSFPRPTHYHAHRCSRLTRQHGGEQSGLVTLTFGLLILKVVSKSHVTWATSVPIFVSLGLSVLDLDPMYATDGQTSDRYQTASSLNAQPIRGGGIINRSAWLRLAGYVTLTLMIIDKQSNGRRKAVDYRSYRSCNHRISALYSRPQQILLTRGGFRERLSRLRHLRFQAQGQRIGRFPPATWPRSLTVADN